MIKYHRKCKGNAETRIQNTAKARGEWCKPLAGYGFSHFQAARDDRDGRSRYRAAKMPYDYGELGWYRDFSRPYGMGAAFYFVFYNGGNSNG